MTTSATDRKYYLFRTVSEPRKKWLILTGANQGSTDEQLLNAFIPVVDKLLKADRAGFTGWHGQNLPEPSAQQQQMLEPQLRDGKYDIEIGTAVITFDEQAKEPRITADYYVYANEPLLDSSVIEADASAEPTTAWLPWTAAVVAGVGIYSVTSKKTPVLRVVAGGVGAVLGMLLATRRESVW